MKNSYKFTCLGATFLLATASGYANQLYVGSDVGIAFQESAVIHSGFGSPLGTMKFDNGVRAGAVVGYNFCNHFSAEIDASDIYNRISQVGAQPFSGTNPGSAHLNEVPLLLNGIFTWPLGGFRPYVGAGAGAAFGFFGSSNIPGSFFPAGNPQYRSTDVTFAYQGELGCTYDVTSHLDLGLAYKFTGTTEHSWNDNNTPLKTDGTMTHTIMATISYRF